MTKPFISFQNVSVAFQQKKRTIQAVQNVSLDIDQGDIFGIVGYSGAGKSTLVRTLNLLQVPTSGKITVNGQTLFEKKDQNARPQQISAKELRLKRQKIGMIFQHFNLQNERTVFDNVLFALNHAKLKQKEKEAKVHELLELVDLTDRAKQYPSQLSGGQKQRVAIARALANDPEILISDEATSALDPKTTKQILQLLKRLNQEYGLTIVLITHEMDAVKEIANKVAVMQNGQVLEEGSTLAIFTHPQEKLTQEFIETATNEDEAIATISQSPAITALGAGQRFVRLAYSGNNTNEPLITSLYKKYEVQANILYGNVEILQGSEVGALLVVLSGDQDKQAAALANLKEQGVTVTILKEGK
ncbi:methionine ABC transporter ATP-binding protein [Leuconostocaceae bacterium ESL0958]|nr:methionine ABC transporter ATP-binding protein [Leuconostocaceae bacterium ESL0958]